MQIKFDRVHEQHTITNKFKAIFSIRIAISFQTNLSGFTNAQIFSMGKKKCFAEKVEK